MAKNYMIRGLPLRPVADLLPPEFDPDLVETFFACSENPSEVHGVGCARNPVQEMEPADGDAETVPFDLDRSDGPPNRDEAREPFSHWDSQAEEPVFELQTPDGDAEFALPVFDASSPPQMRDIAPVPFSDPDDPFDAEMVGAGAKPSGKGGGGGNDKGKGGGKNNKDPAPDPEPDPIPDPEPDPTPDPEPETNPGSTDPNIYVSGLDTPEGFNIEIVFEGSWTEDLKQAFYNAAEYLSDIITGDVASHNGIDDIRITASLTAIDGAGGYWGWGGTSVLRPDSLLPSAGYMRFDEADTATAQSYGLWDDLILHEMAHALGFGTLWSLMGLVDDHNGDLRFNGANAIEAYMNDFLEIATNDSLAAFGVPIETDGGTGTAGVHWDDGTFGNELMTGQLNWTNELSNMSIAALEDMGYETVYGDDFVFT